jgi:UV DNA damage endonuclease
MFSIVQIYTFLCSILCRLDSIKKNGIEPVKELARKNVEDLLTMIQWNEDNVSHQKSSIVGLFINYYSQHIRFLRLSSDMFPYASHGTYGYSLSYCAPLLACVGELAKKYGHRLTTHPGQYTQLGSPRLEVVEASVRELAYHCEMLDRIGVDVDGVMIVHVSLYIGYTQSLFIDNRHREEGCTKIKLQPWRESKILLPRFFHKMCVTV